MTQNKEKEDAGPTAMPEASNISHIHHKMRKRTSSLTGLDMCQCLPLGRSRYQEKAACYGQREDAVDGEQLVLVSQALHSGLQTVLQKLFPRRDPLSLLVLHMSQLESTPLAPHSNVLYKRRRYHAPAGLLEQVLANVQRVIRAEDELLLREKSGIAIVFPNVDRQGVQTILERVYSSVSLLQAETLIPPLTRETIISLGIGTYPSPAPSQELLYEQAGRVAQSLMLRPVITTQLRGVKPIPSRESIPPIQTRESELHPESDLGGIPFMDLPQTLPARLTQLLSYDLAVELQCAPVGRDHHCLTVAMRNPTDSAALRRLQLVTGMTIFPVACDKSALSLLLAQAW